MNHDQMVACATVGGVAIGGLALSCMSGGRGAAPTLPLGRGSPAVAAGSAAAVVGIMPTVATELSLVRAELAELKTEMQAQHAELRAEMAKITWRFSPSSGAQSHH